MSEMQMTSEKEVVDAMKDLFKANGYINKIEAQIRTKLIEALQAKKSSTTPHSDAPQPSEEILLTNELIREYLEWNGYLYTVSVMASEAGLTSEKKSRSTLCMDVGVKDDERSSGLPLLTNILVAYTERIKKKINKAKNER